MQKIKLSDIKNALMYGYLPKDWADEVRGGNVRGGSILVFTFDDNLTLQENTIETESGRVYHTELDSDEFKWDEIDEVYINDEDSCEATGRRGRSVTTHENNCVDVNGDWYVTEFLEENDIYTLADGDFCHSDNCHFVENEGEYYHERECYYWESDGEYHLEKENTKNTLFGYSAGPREKWLVDEDSENGKKRFGWGIEIEKNEMPNFDFDKRELYDRTGAVIEEDGSVSDGFELKTPVYNLLSAKTDERLKELKKYCDVKKIDGAGGHIGFSLDGVNDEDLLDMCRGFLPLIYSMHKKRIHNTYCTAKTLNDMKADGSKYQAIRLRGNYIEFRIFSAVKSYETILFRLELFRIIAANLGANFGKVLLMAVNINHPLNKLLGRVYDNKPKFLRLINDAYELDKLFGAGRLTADGLGKIHGRIDKVFSPSISAAETRGHVPFDVNGCDYIE